jgi:hypothetical protein
VGDAGVREGRAVDQDPPLVGELLTVRHDLGPTVELRQDQAARQIAPAENRLKALWPTMMQCFTAVQEHVPHP